MLSVSVIIPVCNGENFLEATIESLLEQSTPAQEILVVDDGSTDKTAAILSNYGPPIRTIRTANNGAAAARNRGLKEAKSDLVAFLDADDISLPQRLERQQRSLSSDSAAVMTFCAMKYIDASGELTGAEIRCSEFQRVGFYGQLLERNRIGSTSVAMARRELLMNLGGFDESLAFNEEYDLWLRVASRFPIIYQDEVLLHYRLHQNNISSSRAGQKLNEKLALLKHPLDSIQSALKEAYPDHTDSQLALAQVMCRRGELDRMGVVLEKLRDQGLENPKIHFLSGNHFWLCGETSKAREAFLNCLQIEPNYAAAHNNLGIVFASSNYQEQARQAFSKAMELKHQYADPKHNLDILNEGLQENWHFTAVPLREVLKPELDH